MAIKDNQLKEKRCSFFGHRNTVTTPELCNKLKQIVLYLIKEKGVKWFLFGSASNFDELCLKTVTEIQKDHPEIKRIYVRSHYPHIDKRYKDYLLESYDDTLMPSEIENAGKASYVERNRVMINASDFCVFYYDREYKLPIRKRSIAIHQPNSGTKLAYEYAKKKGVKIINLANEKS